jgi:hypothetical protein
MAKMLSFKITLLPYLYYEMGESKLVFIDKDNPSPDPGKLMLWGYCDDGDSLPGDYKRNFERVGNPISWLANVNIPRYFTALQEKSLRVKAIREKIRTMRSFN